MYKTYILQGKFPLENANKIIFYLNKTIIFLYVLDSKQINKKRKKYSNTNLVSLQLYKTWLSLNRNARIIMYVHFTKRSKARSIQVVLFKFLSPETT